MILKIAIASAFGWPYVRRGNRHFYEFAVYLASQGHEVHIITTKPGSRGRKKIYGKVLMKYHPLMEHPLLTRFKIHYWQTFGLSCLYSLLREDFDIVHTNLTFDGFAASIKKSVKDTPFVHLVINGEPLYRDARRCRWMFGWVVRKASRVVTPSTYVKEILKKEFGVEGVLIPAPVDTSKFFHSEEKEIDPPRILCTAALTQGRKRIPLLVKAFERLIERVPHAILQLTGETTSDMTRDILMSVNLRARRSIEILDITSDDVLASCYRDATISVIPSLKEPFGMVTTESLASGTPVVGTRSGATPEILDDPRVGVLFEPTDGPDELCKTLLKGLELAHDPQTSKRCSQHAQKYAWSTLGPQYEELYCEILNNKSRRSYRRPRNPTEEKIISLGMSDQSVQFRSQAGKRSLNQFFVETLDDLDITYDAYYKIDSYRPRCLYILNWIIANGINKGNVLVLSNYPHFLTVLLEKLGFNVKEIAINQWLKTGEEADGYEIFPSPQIPTGLEESFDVIVCDDLLQHLVSPVKVLQVLKKWLIPKGLVILTTPNATRGSLRLRLLIENIYSKLEDILANGGSPRRDNYHAMCYREYTLREVEDVLSRAEFELIHKKCFIGKKFIYNRISFSPMTVKTYLLKKMYNQFQKIIIPQRSHLFVAGRNNQPADGNNGEMISQ